MARPPRGSSATYSTVSVRFTHAELVELDALAALHPSAPTRSDLIRRALAEMRDRLPPAARRLLDATLP